MRFQVQAHFVCLHEVMIPKSGIRFSEKIMTKQKIVQQHSGDWAMAGKVPVARVEGQAPFARNDWKDESHPAHQDHGRIAGR